MCFDQNSHLSDAVGYKPNHVNPWAHLNPSYNHRSPHNTCEGKKNLIDIHKYYEIRLMFEFKTNLYLPIAQCPTYRI